MPTPTNSISTKELSGLEDILGIEQTLASKYITYAGMCNDPALSKKFTAVANKHQRHFNTLVGYLNG